MCGLTHCSNLLEFYEDTKKSVGRSMAPVGAAFATIATMKLWEVQVWLRNLSSAPRKSPYGKCHAKFDPQIEYKVRGMIEASNEAIRRHWRPARWVAVDEVLHPFRGRWAHLQKILGKPGKGIGIKLWACCECGTGMLLSCGI